MRSAMLTLKDNNSITWVLEIIYEPHEAILATPVFLHRTRFVDSPVSNGL